MTLYLRVADELRAAIRSGTYPPGSALPSERHLAAQLAVHRDAVRDAFNTLAGDGIVIKRPGTTAMVTPEPAHEPVPLPAGSTVTARMPTPQEREDFGIDRRSGVPVLVVHRPGEPDGVYPAHRIALLG